MSRPLRLAMLGCWHIHAEVLAKQISLHADEFELVALFDPEPDVAYRKFAALRKVLPSLQLAESAEALLSLDIDAVAVEGRVRSNVDFARQAIKAGKHVLLEKPAGTNLHEYEELIALAKETGKVVQMLFVFRWMAAIKKLREWSATGRLGKIHFFRGRLPKELALYDTYVAELGEYPGGIFFEMASHLVDLMISLMGEPVSVHSTLGHHHPSAIDFVDNGVAVYRFKQGLGLIDISALETAPDQRRIEVLGDQGNAIIPHLGSGHLTNSTTQRIGFAEANARSWDWHDLPAEPLHITDLWEFAGVIHGERLPSFSNEHDLLVQRWLLRAIDNKETSA